MNDFKKNLKPIVIIVLIFILSRIIILASIVFIKIGPFSHESSTYHWITDESTITIPSLFEKLTITANSYKEISVDIFVNGKQVSTIELDTHKKEYIVQFDREYVQPANVISFTTEDFYIPKDVKLFSSDSRKLSWKIWSICIDDISTNLMKESNITGNGVFGEVTENPDFNEVVDSIRAGLTTWDGAYYLSIADNGYSFNGDFGIQQNVAWPYIYPLLTRLLKVLIPIDSGWAAIVISNIMLLISLFIIHKISIEVIGKGFMSYIPLILLCFNPFGIFLCAAYSESTFILFSSIGLLWLLRSKRFKSSLAAGASTGVRTVGVIFPFLYLYDYFLLQRNRLNRRNIVIVLSICAVSVWGLVSFLLYNQYKFGDFMIPFRIQQAWTTDWHRDIIGYGAFVARNIAFSFNILNPDYLGTAIFSAFLLYAVVYFIKYRKTMTRSEHLLALYSILIMMIPVINRHNVSFGRFTLTVYPVLILFCNKTHNSKGVFLISYVLFATFIMVIYSMRFACGQTPF